jgi:hypothetical protein
MQPETNHTALGGRLTNSNLLCFLRYAAIIWLAFAPSRVMAQVWTAVSPLPSPPVIATGAYTPANATPYLREWTKPVYDDTDHGLLVYFANPNCCSGTFSNAIFLYRVSSNSWTLVWSHMTTANALGLADAPDAPSDNHPYHAMAWDSNRGVLWKAFGSAQIGGDTGNCGDCGVNDTYKFNPATGEGVWTEVCGNTMAVCPPGALQESTLAYDPVHDTLVLYGGLKGGTPSADTWEYTPTNNTWTKTCGLEAPGPSACGPPQLDAPGLVYDASLGRFVLFGGMVPPAGSPMNTATWLYDVATHSWSQVNTPTNPPASKFPVMDYVPRLGAVILIGSEQPSAHTWAFNGVQWIDLNIASGPALSVVPKENQGSYDVSADRFVLFLPGASNTGDVWSLDLPSSLNGLPAPGPSATLSQTNLSFAGEPVGTTSSTQNVSLTNTGTTALTINSIGITGTNMGDFNQTNSCPVAPATLSVGGVCTLGLTFKPSTAGAESAVVTISDNSAKGSPQTVVLAGTGISAGPVASLSPSTLTFGSQLVSTSSVAQTLTMANTGNAGLSISSIAVLGTNSSDFNQTNNCPMSPATLAVGGSCTISFTFKPSTAGAKSALLTVSDNSSGGAQTVGLAGTSVASGPIASLSPSMLTFGSQIVNTSSAIQTLTLANPGNAGLSINSIAVTGTNSSDFTQTNNCPMSPGTLAVGGTCTINFTFKPSTMSGDSALAIISDNASGGTQTVMLVGTGTSVLSSGPLASLSPSTLTFASQAVGTASAAQAITLRNTGNAGMILNSIALVGTNVGDFVQTNTCPLPPTTLAAGSSCVIKVTFTPSSAVSETATVRVSDNATGGLQNASVSGVGIAVPTFNISASPSIATVRAGQSANYRITVTPVDGQVNDTVSLSCSELPTNVSCSLAPSTLIPGANPVSSTLTISTTSSAGVHLPFDAPTGTWPAYASRLILACFALLAFSIMAWGHNSRRLIGAFGMTLICALAVFQISCASVNATSPGIPSGTSKTITVTATSGSHQTSAKLTLIIN